MGFGRVYLYAKKKLREMRAEARQRDFGQSLTKEEKAKRCYDAICAYIREVKHTDNLRLIERFRGQFGIGLVDDIVENKIWKGKSEPDIKASPWGLSYLCIKVKDVHPLPD